MNTFYEEIMNKIIKSIESGSLPWERPWTSLSSPVNFITNKNYQGINTFILLNEDFSCSKWGTFKQITDAGGKINKGAKHTKIVFWKFKKYITKTERGEVEEVIPLLRFHQVFNLDQTTGLEDFKKAENKLNFVPELKAEEIINNYIKKPEIKHGGDRAFYSPLFDYISMPNKPQFYSTVDYYSTIFHELAHSTGHPNRLSRFNLDKLAHKKSEGYSREELIAEFASSFLMAHSELFKTNIEKRSASYIEGWAEYIKNDKFAILTCAGQAQKVCNYILNNDKIENEGDDS